MPENFKTFAIALDTKQELYVQPFTIYEGDTGNRFVITLTDDGVAVDLTDCRVAVVFSGAMGTAMQDSWTGTGDVSIGGASHNIITIDVHSGAYATGLNTCEVQVYSGATFTTLITSAFFTFTGEKPILDDETIQAAEAYPTLVYWAGVVEGLVDREQSDWNQTDNTKGNYIQNKPVAGTGFQDATQNLTAETTLADADTVPFYDASATEHRKSTWANIVSTIRTLFFGTTSGILKANGSGVISAAVSNTDYAAAAHASRHSVAGADALSGYATVDANSKVTASEASAYINEQSDSYTLVLADAGKFVKMTKATASNLTVPLNSSVAFPIGTEIEFVQYGAGQVTLVPTGGVTIRNSISGTKTTKQYSLASIKKLATDEWISGGDLIP